MLVKNWMSKKVITVNADDTMQNAIYILQEQNIKILPVMDDANLVGIITDRDLKKASPSDATTLDMHELLFLVSKIKVRDLMKKPVYTAKPDDTVEEAAARVHDMRAALREPPGAASLEAAPPDDLRQTPHGFPLIPPPAHAP